MKITKLSLVAALLIGSSAMALENTKVTGDANLYYQTTDAKDLSDLDRGEGSLFDAASSSATASLNLNVTTDLVKNDTIALSAGAGYTVLTTLGLENNLVGNVWGGSQTITKNTSAFGYSVNNTTWVNEAWLAATAGNTTVKLGRMELDTPLAFTEKWSIEKNTFEAAVLINTDIPDTTVVAAFIGNGNGTEAFGEDTLQSNTQGYNLSSAAVVNGDGTFATYGKNGAYAVGMINNSVKPLTVQAWYYDLTRLATAYWVQADVDAGLLAKGLSAGVQYSGVTADGGDENTVAAGKIAYDAGTFSVSGAYSKVSETGTLAAAGFNTATAAGTTQSKLYTEAQWNFGNVTKQGAKSVNVTVESSVGGIDLGLYATSINHVAANSDLLEVAAKASKSFGPIDASVLYLYVATDAVSATKDNVLQVYLTANF